VDHSPIIVFPISIFLHWVTSIQKFMGFILNFVNIFPPLRIMHSIVKIRATLTYGILADLVTNIYTSTNQNDWRMRISRANGVLWSNIDSDWHKKYWYTMQPVGCPTFAKASFCHITQWLTPLHWNWIHHSAQIRLHNKVTSQKAKLITYFIVIISNSTVVLFK